MGVFAHVYIHKSTSKEAQAQLPNRHRGFRERTQYHAAQIVRSNLGNIPQF